MLGDVTVQDDLDADDSEVATKWVESVGVLQGDPDDQYVITDAFMEQAKQMCCDLDAEDGGKEDKGKLHLVEDGVAKWAEDKAKKVMEEKLKDAKDEAERVAKLEEEFLKTQKELQIFRNKKSLLEENQAIAERRKQSLTELVAELKDRLKALEDMIAKYGDLDDSVRKVVQDIIFDTSRASEELEAEWDIDDGLMQ